MRVYFYFAVLAGLLFPLGGVVLWSPRAAASILDGTFGIALCLSFAIAAALVFGVMRHLSLGAAAPVRPLIIRLVGAEIAGALSILILILMVGLESDMWAWPSLQVYVVMHFPGFIAYYVTCFVVARLVGPLVPQAAPLGNRRPE